MHVAEPKHLCMGPVMHCFEKVYSTRDVDDTGTFFGEQHSHQVSFEDMNSEEIGKKFVFFEIPRQCIVSRVLIYIYSSWIFFVRKVCKGA